MASCRLVILNGEKGLNANKDFCFRVFDPKNSSGSGDIATINPNATNIDVGDISEYAAATVVKTMMIDCGSANLTNIWFIRNKKNATINNTGICPEPNQISPNEKT